MEIKKEITQSEICCHTISFSAAHHFFHWHENYEICRVIKNSCKFRIDGILYEADEGDIITVPPHVVHQFIIERDDTEINILQFPLSLLLHLGEAILPLKPHIRNCELLSSPHREKFSTLLGFMAEEKPAKTSGENPFFESLAVSYYLLLQTHFSADIAENTKHRDEFFKITEYINHHFRNEINLSSVAAALYLSRNKTADIFKKYSGMSVNEYINTLRIKNANRMLNEGCTATETALACGFSNIRTFNNVYKKLMNITPSQYTDNKTKNRNE